MTTAVTTTGDYRNPDWQYVSQILNDYRWELDGMHRKITEIEALKYYEDSISLGAEEKKTGQEVHIGLTAELLENVKAALLAENPVLHFEGLRDHIDAPNNASKREHYWQAHLAELMGGNDRPNYISELVDSQLLGIGILKAAYVKSRWDATIRRKKRGETSNQHVERVNGYKKLWGHPTGCVITHPLNVFFRPGEGARLDEIVEHSYKPRHTVYEQFDLSNASIGETPSQAVRTSVQVGQPDQYVRGLPMGISTTNYVLVTEYWNPKCYKIFINGTQVYAEIGEPSVSYFICPGRTSSSPDPDKYAISVAESLRHNEPLINRLFTRMVEAAELIVNKRNTLEVPESYVPETDKDQDGNTVTRTWSFTDEFAEALPPGAKIVDPFEGASQVYAAMPLLQLMLQITSQHGVSPLFKGISQGAAGSGYRDNSLYMMAKSQFSYLITSMQACLKAYIVWQEWLLVNHIKEKVWCGEDSLEPKDITEFPARITVEMKPELPQNLIAEGEFWERQREARNVSRRFTREKLGIEQPNEMDLEVDLETMKEMLLPYLMQDVVGTVLGKGPMAPGSGLVAADGKTPITSDSNQPPPPGTRNGTTGSIGGPNGAGRQELAGRATGGQAQAPATPAGATQ